MVNLNTTNSYGAQNQMMKSVSAKMADQNNFAMNFTTSDGDKISLSMYDNKSMGYSDNGMGEKSMSLSHSYGYSFKYEGNGLSAQDMKEIEEAMKEVKPMLNEYLKNVEESNTLYGGSPLGQMADKMKALLPEPKDENHDNAIKSNTLDSFDSVLKMFDENDKVLQSARDLFDKLFSNIESEFNSLYA
jgi:hypothetical protein